MNKAQLKAFLDLRDGKKVSSSRFGTGGEAARVLEDLVQAGAVTGEFHRSRKSYCLVSQVLLDGVYGRYPELLSLEDALKLREGGEYSRHDRAVVFRNSKFGGATATILGFTLFCNRECRLCFEGCECVIPFGLGFHVRKGLFPILPDGSKVIVVENYFNLYDLGWLERLGFGGDLVFVACRCPSSKVLVEFLKQVGVGVEIIYFGDFDPSGVKIYKSQFKKHLGDRIRFFVPDGLEEKMNSFSSLYSKQVRSNDGKVELDECDALLRLMNELHGTLEQEYF